MLKVLLGISLISLLMGSCGTKEEEFENATEIVFDCETLFSGDNFGSLCFVGNEPIVVELETNTSFCIAQIGRQPNGDEFVNMSIQSTIVVPIVPGIPTPAEAVFTGIKGGSIGAVKDISNLGNEAFLVTDESSGNRIENDLIIRYANLVLTFETDYRTADGAHCASNEAELVKLAQIILAKLG